MKRLDEGKVSLVEFLRSIKARKSSEKGHTVECETHFATLSPKARAAQPDATDDSSTVPSAN
ncbi:MAG: hypothetical protein HKN19_04090 [Halioglobus sp.]|nr:hypothetical protein [Halioglobus sp.]